MRRLRSSFVAAIMLALAATTAACIPAPTPPPAPATPTTRSGMWLDPSEVMALPMSGAAWDRVRATAHADWGQVELWTTTAATTPRSWPVPSSPSGPATPA
ncbi:hypothetical protein HC251_07745 [Iamia sp. SCSIO 61187]|uniref:hypothetical protein n=1 Tax=Iamia sp. SCSIO 61187 TaxID=2722752 RepID=UPI001C62A122|nr:hypothetical protein [Iamia sp. SCSIO 61187]QYG90959.1 hypothetical protein HC251_07745 [Iamia sp. SCSIO 61187]